MRPATWHDYPLPHLRSMSHGPSHPCRASLPSITSPFLIRMTSNKHLCLATYFGLLAESIILSLFNTQLSVVLIVQQLQHTRQITPSLRPPWASSRLRRRSRRPRTWTIDCSCPWLDRAGRTDRPASARTAVGP